MSILIIRSRDHKDPQKRFHKISRIYRKLISKRYLMSFGDQGISPLECPENLKGESIFAGRGLIPGFGESFQGSQEEFLSIVYWELDYCMG